MNSHNHPMLGSVGSWLYRAIGGIRAGADGPGFAAFEVRPQVDGRLQHVHCTLNTVRGVVRSSWQIHDGRLQVTVGVPVGSTARICLPAPPGELVLESNLVVWEEEQAVTPTAGIQDIVREDEMLVCTVGSGEYHFSAALGQRRL